MRVQLRDLSPGQDYVVQFRSNNGEDVSEWSQVFRFRTDGDVTAPGPVQNLQWLATGASFVGTWNKPVVDANGKELKDFADYLVTISATLPGGGTVIKTYNIIANTFELTLPMNQQVFGQIAITTTIKVQARDQTGNLSTPVQVTTTEDTPPVPSTPTVTTYLGQLIVGWDGKTSSGTITPFNYSHVEIHASTTDNFTPTPSTSVARFEGSYTGPQKMPLPNLANYGTVVYVKLVSLNKLGRVSAPSAQASGTPTRISGLDIQNGAITTTQINFADQLGGGKAYYQTAFPTTGMKEGDTFFDTDDGYHLYVYSSGQWREARDATVIDNNRIQTGAITAVKIAAGAITADKVGTNQIIASSANIATAAIDAANIASVNANTITTGTLTSAQQVIINGSSFPAFSISMLGDATFNTGTFRGDIRATSGTFSGNINFTGKLEGDGYIQIPSVASAPNYPVSTQINTRGIVEKVSALENLVENAELVAIQTGALSNTGYGVSVLPSGGGTMSLTTASSNSILFNELKGQYASYPNRAMIVSNSTSTTTLPVSSNPNAGAAIEIGPLLPGSYVYGVNFAMDNYVANTITTGNGGFDILDRNYAVTSYASDKKMFHGTSVHGYEPIAVNPNGTIPFGITAAGRYNPSSVISFQGRHTGRITIPNQSYTDTNLCTNPSFEVNTTGWTFTNCTAAVTTGSPTVADSGTGYVALTNNSTAGPAMAQHSVAVTAGQTYSIQYKMKIGSTSSSYNTGSPFLTWMVVTYLNSSSAVITTSPTVYDTDDVRLSNKFKTINATFVAPAGAVTMRVSIQYGLRGRKGTSSAMSSILDSVLIVPGRYNGEYFDGSFSGGTWSGTAHASTSTYTRTNSAQYFYIKVPPGYTSEAATTYAASGSGQGSMYYTLPIVQKAENLADWFSGDYGINTYWSGIANRTKSIMPSSVGFSSTVQGISTPRSALGRVKIGSSDSFGGKNYVTARRTSTATQATNTIAYMGGYNQSGGFSIEQKVDDPSDDALAQTGKMIQQISNTAWGVSDRSFMVAPVSGYYAWAVHQPVRMTTTGSVAIEVEKWQDVVGDPSFLRCIGIDRVTQTTLFYDPWQFSLSGIYYFEKGTGFCVRVYNNVNATVTHPTDNTGGYPNYWSMTYLN